MEQQNFYSPAQTIEISRSDRWQIHQRLGELGISSACLQDGSFKVEIHSPLALVQLRSVLWQCNAPRQQLLDWLDQCWQKS